MFGTGLCFVLHGSLSWLAGFIVLPLLLLWPGTPEVRQRRARRVVSASFRWLLALIAGLRVGNVEIDGRQWLRQADGKLLVANHPMYLDVLALIALLPQAGFVIKHAMFRNRLYRRFIQVAGYLSNASQAALVDDCAAALGRGDTLVLCPEGTRSTPGQPLHFQRGAAHVALRSRCNILPVVIRCEPLALGQGQPWHAVADRPWRLHLTICPPQTLTELGWQPHMPEGVAARRVTHAMEDFFSRALASTAGADVASTKDADAHAEARWREQESA